MQGIFLPEWKLATVQQLIKSTNLDTPVPNYRPISYVTFICKLIENTVLQQLNTYSGQ